MDRFQGWIASLDNGETVFETPDIPNEKSAWQKLIKRLRDEKLEITQLRLQRGGTTLIGIPKAEGYIQAYEMVRKLSTGEQTIYQGIGSVVNDLVFINWINDYGVSWQEVRTLNTMRVHSTLQEA